MALGDQPGLPGKPAAPAASALQVYPEYANLGPIDEGTKAYLDAARGISPHISSQQFMNTEWRNSYDPQGCPPNMPFHSTKQGGDSACVEKPDNCPEGKTAWGQNECVEVGSRPYSGGENIPGTADYARVRGAPAGAAAAPAAASAAPPKPLTLQEQLVRQFKQQQGAFGFSAGRNPLAQKLAGQFGPTGPGIKGMELAGGGLVWGPSGGYTDLAGFGGGPLVTAGSQGDVPETYDTGTPGYKPWEKPSAEDLKPTIPGVPAAPGLVGALPPATPSPLNKALGGQFGPLTPSRRRGAGAPFTTNYARGGMF